MKWLPLILGSVLLGVLGQLSLKSGVSNVEPGSPGSFLIRALTTPMVLVGLAIYALSSLLWLLILSKVTLSYAYPMLSLGYVLVVVASATFFREQVSPARWLALLVICGGVALLARS
ncbi:MAG: hypothetical protein HY677_01330 [Chloroflexi bacterium]|nr:hypothetical protein [Chloroflexota bacterium]